MKLEDKFIIADKKEILDMTPRWLFGVELNNEDKVRYYELKSDILHQKTDLIVKLADEASNLWSYYNNREIDKLRETFGNY